MSSFAQVLAMSLASTDKAVPGRTAVQAVDEGQTELLIEPTAEEMRTPVKRVVAVIAGVWLAVSSCGGSMGGYRRPGVGTHWRSLTATQSGKLLAIYREVWFQSAARDVPKELVVQGMRASSMAFDEEEIQTLLPVLLPALAKLEYDQRLAIENLDTSLHVFVSAPTGELQFVGYRAGQEISRHHAELPPKAPETGIAVEATPSPPAKTELVTEPAEVAKPITKPATKPKAKPQRKPQTRLTDSEIRTKLGELERLRDKGLISDSEYQQKRKALLDQL